MNKLLSAEFARLFKSFVFRLCLLFSAGLSAFAIISRFLDVKQNSAIYEQLDISYRNADGLIFVVSLYLIFALAVFVGIFVGTEYSDGTIRNKLMVGHTRGMIYLSKLIVCAAAAAIIQTLSIVISLAMGELLIGGTTMDAPHILITTVVSIVIMLALAATLLLFSMSIQSKAIGSVACLLTVVIMLFASLMIGSGLGEPEYYDSYQCIDTDTGEMISMPREKNPRYLTGTKRKVYEFLNNTLPVSQLYQISTYSPDSPENLGLMPLVSCIEIVVMTGAGMLIFRKRNLK